MPTTSSSYKAAATTTSSSSLAKAILEDSLNALAGK
jgi:hypothetical protein